MDSEVDPEVRERALSEIPLPQYAEEERYEMKAGSREFVPLRWIVDDCVTINEVVTQLRRLADELAGKVDDGFELEFPVDNGFISIVRGDAVS